MNKLDVIKNIYDIKNEINYKEIKKDSEFTNVDEPYLVFEPIDDYSVIHSMRMHGKSLANLNLPVYDMIVWGGNNSTFNAIRSEGKLKGNTTYTVSNNYRYTIEIEFIINNISNSIVKINPFTVDTFITPAGSDIEFNILCKAEHGFTFPEAYSTSRDDYTAIRHIGIYEGVHKINLTTGVSIEDCGRTIFYSYKKENPVTLDFNINNYVQNNYIANEPQYGDSYVDMERVSTNGHWCYYNEYLPIKPSTEYVLKNGNMNIVQYDINKKPIPYERIHTDHQFSAGGVICFKTHKDTRFIKYTAAFKHVYDRTLALYETSTLRVCETPNMSLRAMPNNPSLCDKIVQLQDGRYVLEKNIVRHNMNMTSTSITSFRLNHNNMVEIVCTYNGGDYRGIVNNEMGSVYASYFDQIIYSTRDVNTKRAVMFNVSNGDVLFHIPLSELGEVTLNNIKDWFNKRSVSIYLGCRSHTASINVGNINQIIKPGYILECINNGIAQDLEYKRKYGIGAIIDEISSTYGNVDYSRMGEYNPTISGNIIKLKGDSGITIDFIKQGYNSPWGNALALGGGQALILGGGESYHRMLERVQSNNTDFGLNRNGESLILSSDYNIEFFTYCQNNRDDQIKRSYMDVNGNMFLNDVRVATVATLSLEQSIEEELLLMEMN